MLDPRLDARLVPSVGVPHLLQDQRMGEPYKYEYATRREALHLSSNKIPAASSLPCRLVRSHDALFAVHTLRSVSSPTSLNTLMGPPPRRVAVVAGCQ